MSGAAEPAVHLDDLGLADIERRGDPLGGRVDARCTSFSRCLRRLKNSLRWAWVVPSFTRRQLLRMNLRM